MSVRMIWFGTLAGLTALAACGSSDNAVCKANTGAVTGAADSHCGTNVVTVDPSMCAVPDAGVGSVDAGPDMPDYGDTMFNGEGDDDDCKYHVKWSVTPMCQNGGVSFTVIATNKIDNSPLTGAHPDAEVFLDATHPAPNSDTTFVESPPGTYRIGPVRMDKSGQWTVRFHFRDDCTDTEASPHGHAAFFVNVP